MDTLDEMAVGIAERRQACRKPAAERRQNDPFCNKHGRSWQKTAAVPK